MAVVLAAGATAGVDCSLCEAGTYGTGSGEDTLCERSSGQRRLLIDRLSSLSIAISQLAVSGDVLLMGLAAGATTGLNCSLCEAGAYGTASGQDTLVEGTRIAPDSDAAIPSVLLP